MVKKEDVLKALSNVIDPELGLDLVELGMIYDVKVKDDFVEVDITLTSPGCPIASQLLSDCEKAILELEGITKVKVEFVFNPPWSPERMTPEARAKLGM